MGTTDTRAGEFSRVATRAWLWLLVPGAAAAAFNIAGVVSGWRELSAGVLHIYTVCDALVGVLPVNLHALVSGLSGLMFSTAGIGLVSVIWDVVRAQLLARQFSRKRLPVGEGLSVLLTRLGLLGRVTLVEDPAMFALTMGFFRPWIVVSSGLLTMLEASEVEAVLRHEAVHLKRSDPVRHLLAQAARRALFFIPTARDYWTRYVTAAELAADADVVAGLGRDPLAKALIKMVDHALGVPASVGVPGMRTTMDIRVEFLLDPGRAVVFPGVSWLRLALSAAPALAILGALPLQTPPSFLDVFAHAGLAACSI